MRAGCLALLSSLPRSRAKMLDRFTALDRPTPVTRWLRQIATDPPASTPASPDSLVQAENLHSRIIIWPRCEGANTANLRPLSKASASCTILRSPKIALINAHSLVNKTYILNYFITAHDLDFLFITESWVKVGDLSPYSELVPADYYFYNAPRSSGRGGGLAIIAKDSFRLRCRLLSPTTFTSFEAQVLLLNWSEPVALALMYRPPHLIKDFIVDFRVRRGFDH